MPTPVITGITSDSTPPNQPTATYTITGTDFGATEGLLLFYTGTDGFLDLTLTVDSWTDTEIIFYGELPVGELRMYVVPAAGGRAAETVFTVIPTVPTSALPPATLLLFPPGTTGLRDEDPYELPLDPTVNACVAEFVEEYPLDSDYWNVGIDAFRELLIVRVLADQVTAIIDPITESRLALYGITFTPPLPPA